MESKLDPDTLELFEKRNYSKLVFCGGPQLRSLVKHKFPDFFRRNKGVLRILTVLYYVERKNYPEDPRQLEGLKEFVKWELRRRGLDHHIDSIKESYPDPKEEVVDCFGGAYVDEANARDIFNDIDKELEGGLL